MTDNEDGLDIPKFLQRKPGDRPKPKKPEAPEAVVPNVLYDRDGRDIYKDVSDF